MSDLQTSARRALSMMDLTSLNDEDSEESIQQLCSRAQSSGGQVAAVCVYPSFIRCAKEYLRELGADSVRVATVTNFPDGAVDLLGASEGTAAALAAGADEVDVVFPWRALMSGDFMVGEELVQACVRACEGEAKLKVIIESGQLAAPALIRQASEICVGAGANFIKTSTGKVDINATPTAVKVIAEALRDSGANCGLKVSGGVRTAAEAASYLTLAEQVLGGGWASPETFRFGASSLLDSLILVIEGGDEQSSSGGY